MSMNQSDRCVVPTPKGGEHAFRLVHFGESTLKEGVHYEKKIILARIIGFHPWYGFEWLRMWPAENGG